MKYRYGGAILSVLLLGLTSLAHAQSTIDVPITSLLGNNETRGAGQGGNVPTVSGENAGDPPPLNRHIQGFQPGSYAEFPVTTTTPGLYTVSLNMRMTAANDLHTVLSLETRPAPDSLYTTRYATVDTKDYGVMPNYVESGPLVSAGNVELRVPLFAGNNILRIFHVTGRHEAVTTGYPTDLSNPTNRPSGNPWSNLEVATITLNRVADLPALGTINGTITGNQPAGIPVREAMVFANPPGQSPLEPSWFWKNGWYTYTRADGTYTLQAPLGQQEIKAGRPDSYQLQGATTNVTVGATPATANITLPSIFFKNASNEWVAYPQAEYFYTKSGSLALVPLDGPPENGYKIGWTDNGEWYGLLIDVPEAGNYEVTSAYTNGGGEGTFQVYTNLGPSTTDTQPNSGGWNMLGHKTYANPIYLAQGTQILYQANRGGNSDFDGIHLRRLNTPITVGLVQGKVTNATNGAAVAGATVAIGNTTVQTDAEGNYRAIVPVGAGTAITVTHVNQDAAVTGVVDVTAGGVAERNFTITLRPSVALTTANGYTWKYLANTGGTADYSAVAASETGFADITVPSNIADIVPTNDIYIWYRLHFTVPEGFLTAIPNRLVRVRIGGVDDVDATWLNGTLIGQTGSFPTTPLDPKSADYRNPAVGTNFVQHYPGLDLAWNNERLYYFPASLLKTGDNVLAVKVFQLAGGGGLTATPYLEIAPATGTVSGKVLVGGAGQPNIRVAAMSTTGVSSDWAMTAADGSFTLDNVAPGAIVVGAAKPGIKSVSVTTAVAAGATVSNVTLNTTVEPAGVAPLYDDFNATASTDATWWTNLWDATIIEPSNPRVTTDDPVIFEPGYQAIAYPVETASDPRMPNTITIQSGSTGHRGGLLSKARFSKFASVNAGRLVSALPAPGSNALNTSDNAIFRLVGNAAADNPATINSANYVELDIEGYVNVEGEFGIPEQRIRYRLFASHGGELSNGAVPSTMTSLSELSMENGLELMITRVGSYYDFYVNGTRVHGQNLPNAQPDNHKIFLYSWASTQVHTWDWVKAGPAAYAIAVKGDLNGNGTVDTGDAARALQLAGGLSAATQDDITNGDVVAGNGITLLDALRIARAANGQPL